MAELLTERPPMPVQQFELVVYLRQDSRVFLLTQGSSVGIGRSPDNQIQIDDPSVSRHHARLRILDEVIVEDLGSANGTTLVRNARPRPDREDTDIRANQRLTPGELASMTPGDVLRIGPVLLVLQKRGRSTPVEAPEPHGNPVNGGPAVLIDPEMRRVYELISRAAASDISVLILGETGAGKEVVAETVHRRSPRADKPFLRLNCAALPESLLEGELFGHEKGAFTGAHSTKAGLIESTDGGTVFLDEIGELPLGTQAKLLRVLEERTVIRLGATKPRRVNVRFVTATNRDLSREVRASRFRGDLYYRISGLVVRVPPLRKRRAEIEPLARHFLKDFCARAGQAPPELAADAAELLYGYDWPGNVRELRNVMERAALLANGGQIKRDHVLLEPALPELELEDADDFDAVTEVTKEKPQSLRPFSEEEAATGERDRVIRALESCGGNQTRAAKLLGVSRRTLINRLEQFQLPRPKKG
ncbi:MAG TPA: sigma 54-interacting transcriptional regulator [Polyangiaceae bacterium]|nr:sigma 54-interacting transcriptional regulator [Polyangiaceae bacterium]